MATASDWVAGARPRTLPAAVAPVLAGTGVAAWSYDPELWEWSTWWAAAMALVVSLSLQVGVNYANDYSDGIRGTDDDRVGPMRLVGSGRATPAAVKRAMLIAFGVAALAGLTLVIMTGTWWLIAVGAVCIAAAWFYTGGSKPYGYLGLGEVMVFVFFGLVATVGTTYVLVTDKLGPLNTRLTCTDGVCFGEGHAEIPVWILPATLAGIAIGALACAILVANNLRDIPTDIEAHKMTLAVRLGDRRTRFFYAALVVLALVALMVLAATTSWWALAGLAFLAPAAAGTRTVLGGASGPGLIPVLQSTGMAELILGAGVFIGLLNAG